jgi:ABC-type uncharacterized transport system ATPase subunit
MGITLVFTLDLQVPKKHEICNAVKQLLLFHMVSIIHQCHDLNGIFKIFEC